MTLRHPVDPGLQKAALLAQNSPDLLPEFDENGPFCCARFPSDLPRLNGCLHDRGKRCDCFSARSCRGSSLENTARKKAPFRCEVEFGAASSVRRALFFRLPSSLMSGLFHVKQLSQCSAISEQMFHVKHSAVRRRSGCRRRKDASVEGGEKVGRASLARRRWATARAGGAGVGNGVRARCAGRQHGCRPCARRVWATARARHARGPSTWPWLRARGDGSGPQLRAAGGCARRRGRAHVASGALRDRRFGPPSASSGTPPFASQQACRRRARRERSGCRAAKRTGRRARPP